MTLAQLPGTATGDMVTAATSTAAHPAAYYPLINMECLAQGYNVELSRESVTTLHCPDPTPQASVQPITRYYRPHFVGREHANFVGEDSSSVSENGPVVVSFLLLSPSSVSSNSNFVAPASPLNSNGAATGGTTIANGADGHLDEWSKVIVRTKKEDIRLLVPYSSSRKEMLKSISRAVSYYIRYFSTLVMSSLPFFHGEGPGSARSKQVDGGEGLQFRGCSRQVRGGYASCQIQIWCFALLGWPN